jgi:hypothetical protein
MQTLLKSKIEFGDFQTPRELADLVCQKLVEMGVKPDVIIEPTCGFGAFVQAAAQAFEQARRIIGVEINQAYLEHLSDQIGNSRHAQRIELLQGDFFTFDWAGRLDDIGENILVLGNFPWVTNAGQGVIGGSNLPAKSNFQRQRGLEAITGKGNFDISEWMLIQVVEWLRHRTGSLAMLCKKSVARKLLSYIHRHQLALAQAAMYGIDAKIYFGASVEACLIYCRFDRRSRNYDCDVYPDLGAAHFTRMGFRDGVLVNDLAAFGEPRHLRDANPIKWRSGVKHDCAEVMEFKRIGNQWINGLAETIDIEGDYLYPLLKGSAVANGRVAQTDRYVLVTQQVVGESTAGIKLIAPKTWLYLESHAKYLDGRKSQVYLKTPRFSIFGVGDYTFKPWKVAICGLYKSFQFRLVGPINDRPVVFDDTVYFLGFDNEQAAIDAFNFVNSPSARKLLSTLVFWDEKRPIKTSILNRLNMSGTPVTQPTLL